MAGDKQFTHNGMKMLGKTKIFEIPTLSCKELFGVGRAFVGFAGNADNFYIAQQWLETPDKKVPKLRGIEMLMLTDQGKIYHASQFENWMELGHKHYAIGSGMYYAISAMECGKNPYEAVKVASKYDPNTGMQYNKLVMKESP